MKLSDITIVIPTTGRDSLKKAVQSIPSGCPIIIGWDSPSSNLPIFTDNSMIKYKLYAYKSAGKTKQALIDEVKTPWFMILDDDDEIIEGYLQLASYTHSINKHLNPMWISSHWTKETPKTPLAPDNKSNKWEIITPENFEKYYFDWSYGKLRSEKYTLGHVIPSSAVIMNTTEFRNCRMRFKFDFLDEVIPTTYFMASHKGILHKYYGLKYTSLEDSVSHPTSDPSLTTDYLKVIADMANVHLHDSNLTSTLWARVITNAIEATRFNYQKHLHENS